MAWVPMEIESNFLEMLCRSQGVEPPEMKVVTAEEMLREEEEKARARIAADPRNRRRRRNNWRYFADGRAPIVSIKELVSKAAVSEKHPSAVYSMAAPPSPDPVPEKRMRMEVDADTVPEEDQDGDPSTDPANLSVDMLKLHLEPEGDVADPEPEATAAPASPVAPEPIPEPDEVIDHEHEDEGFVEETIPVQVPVVVPVPEVAPVLAQGPTPVTVPVSVPVQVPFVTSSIEPVVEAGDAVMDFEEPPVVVPELPAPLPPPVQKAPVTRKLSKPRLPLLLQPVPDGRHAKKAPVKVKTTPVQAAQATPKPARRRISMLKESYVTPPTRVEFPLPPQVEPPIPRKSPIEIESVPPLGYQRQRIAHTPASARRARSPNATPGSDPRSRSRSREPRKAYGTLFKSNPVKLSPAERWADSTAVTTRPKDPPPPPPAQPAARPLEEKVMNQQRVAHKVKRSQPSPQQQPEPASAGKSIDSAMPAGSNKKHREPSTACLGTHVERHCDVPTALATPAKGILSKKISTELRQGLVQAAPVRIVAGAQRSKDPAPCKARVAGSAVSRKDPMVQKMLEDREAVLMDMRRGKDQRAASPTTTGKSEVLDDSLIGLDDEERSIVDEVDRRVRARLNNEEREIHTQARITLWKRMQAEGRDPFGDPLPPANKKRGININEAANQHCFIMYSDEEKRWKAEKKGKGGL